MRWIGLKKMMATDLIQTGQQCWSGLFGWIDVGTHNSWQSKRGSFALHRRDGMTCTDNKVLLRSGELMRRRIYGYGWRSRLCLAMELSFQGLPTGRLQLTLRIGSSNGENDYRIPIPHSLFGADTSAVAAHVVSSPHVCCPVINL